MLTAIIRDMDRPQSDAAQEIKSKGDAPEAAQTADTAISGG